MKTTWTCINSFLPLIRDFVDFELSFDLIAKTQFLMDLDSRLRLKNNNVQNISELNL